MINKISLNSMGKNQSKNIIESNYLKGNSDKSSEIRKKNNYRNSCIDVSKYTKEPNDLEDFKLDDSSIKVQDDKKKIEKELIKVEKKMNGLGLNDKYNSKDKKISPKKVNHKTNSIKELPIIVTNADKVNSKYDSDKYKNLTNKVKDEEIIKEDNKIDSNMRKAPISKYSSIDVISFKTMNDLNEFNLVKVIGKGTFGKVILVTLKADPKIFYAIKILKKEHLVSTKNVKNILTEKQLLCELSHNFIIKLHFTFKSKEKLFMGFDYHNGGELFFHLQKKKRFSENEVKFYAAELYCAFRYLHSNYIIYRDIKPENIILDKNGHLKIVDFGLAKKLSPDKLYTDTFCGTNEYIPPEVLLGEEYSFNFDWWGFGIIIYELLHGIPPFVDSNKREIFKKIIKSDPKFLSTLSYDCLDIMKRLLSKNLSKRIKPSDIPKHSFFKDLDFEKIEKMNYTAPIIPNIKDDMDTTYIDTVFLNEAISSPYVKPKSYYDDNLFKDF